MRKFSPSCALLKYPSFWPQSAIESTTRCTSCATEVSRSPDPNLPWKYLLATMLVAVCDQSTGTSTSRCSKITEPLSLPIEAVRVSHWISSYGVLPASSLVVKYRGNEIPVLVSWGSWVFNNSILALKSTDSCPMNLSSPRIAVWGNAFVIVPQYVVVRQELYLHILS